MPVNDTQPSHIHKLLLVPLASLLLIVLGACSESTANQTLVADYNTSSTLVADMRMTGTVHAARLQTTLDYSTTRVALAATQSQFLKSTLEGLGYDMNQLNAMQEAAMDGRIQFPTPTQPAPNFSVQQVQDQPDSSVAPVGSATAPADTTPVPPPAGNGPQLINAALATEVGDDDCPISTTTQFTMNTNIIYLTMRAVNITANTTLTARWLRPDGQERTFDWTPDFDINDACVWMYIDQTDEVFVPGVWSVSVELNGTQATDVLNFRIDEMATGS